VAESREDRPPGHGIVRNERLDLVADDSAIRVRRCDEQYHAGHGRVVSSLKRNAPLERLNITELGLGLYSDAPTRTLDHRVPSALVARYGDRHFESPLEGGVGAAAKAVEKLPVGGIPDGSAPRICPSAQVEPDYGKQSSEIAD
jgi:hypothetical protein